MKRNRLQLAPRLFKKLCIRQVLVYGGTGIAMISMLFTGAWFYFNLGNSEEAKALNNPDYTSQPNKQGHWKDPSAWERVSWKETTPQMGTYWTMNLNGTISYIPTDNSDIFTFSNGNKLDLFDTLIIAGNAKIGSDFININEDGLLIILGDLTILAGTPLKNKGRVVVTGDLSTPDNSTINNNADNSNGVYIFGEKKKRSDKSSYGKNLKNETNLKNQDNELYRYVMGLRNVLLPISLLDFSAQKTDNNILLRWSTASEVNNDFFTIERSMDGSNWKAIKTIPGAGNSNKKLDYQFEDRAPLQGYNYYRLKQTDFNGDFEYFKIAGVTFANQHFEAKESFLSVKDIQVGPNPFKESITITYTAASSTPIELIVWDVAGTTVHQEIIMPQPGKNEYTLEQANKWKTGSYIIKMIKNGKAESVKMIKI